MAGTILQISKTPQTVTIQSAKTVVGKFGLQLWCKVIDAHGEECTMYLPWANTDGSMSGVFQQFVKTGVIGPEDFRDDPDVWYDQFRGQTYTFEKVFKDQKQFINVHPVNGVLAAAVKELGLDPHPVPVAAAAAAPRVAPPAATQAPRSTVESINTLYHKAWQYADVLVMSECEQGKAEYRIEDVRSIATALLIAYQKEGVK